MNVSIFTERCFTAQSDHYDVIKTSFAPSEPSSAFPGLSERHRFTLWALEKLQEDPTFFSQILFSDEAHVRLNGYVNKQNCRIWDEKQPEEIQELPFHPEKTTVWCGLQAGGIIGPYFFKNDAGENVTVNGDRYRAMITDYLMPEIEARDLGDIWFQQEFIGEHLDKKIITHFGPVD